MTNSTPFRDLLRAVNLRHGTDGFTSAPKEGVLRIFSPWKILTASAGFEPANLGTERQHTTPRPSKPLELCMVMLREKDRLFGAILIDCNFLRYLVLYTLLWFLFGCSMCKLSEYTGCFIMNVPILKPYISATTNPKWMKLVPREWPWPRVSYDCL